MSSICIIYDIHPESVCGKTYKFWSTKQEPSSGANAIKILAPSAGYKSQHVWASHMPWHAGKHSGRNALKNRLGFLGFELPQERLDDIFKRFKVHARLYGAIQNMNLLIMARIVYRSDS